MDANQYDSWMRRRPKPQTTTQNHLGSDTRATERVHPDMLKRVKKVTRLDDILAPYRGRSYEGPVDPEVV